MRNRRISKVECRTPKVRHFGLLRFCGSIFCGFLFLHGASASRAQDYTNVEIQVTNDLQLVWLWETNYLLSLAVDGAGSIGGASNGWYVAGEAPECTALPAPYWAFQGWTGDFPGSPTNTNPLPLVIDQPRSLVAHFVERRTAQGTPLWWLDGLYGLGTNDTDDLGNPDYDPYLTWQEYLCDTDPTNGASYFRPLQAALGTGTVSVTLLDTVTSRLYRVCQTAQLAAPAWQTNLQSLGTGSNLIYTAGATSGPAFFRANVTLP